MTQEVDQYTSAELVASAFRERAMMVWAAKALVKSMEAYIDAVFPPDRPVMPLLEDIRNDLDDFLADATDLVDYLGNLEGYIHEADTTDLPLLGGGAPDSR